MGATTTTGSPAIPRTSLIVGATAPARLRACGASAMLTADLVANMIIAQTNGRDVDAIQHFWTNGGRWPAESEKVDR